MRERLEALLAERILVLDGAYGTAIQARTLADGDYRGERFADHPRDVKGDPDLLNLTRPDVVEDIHRSYLAAGADIVTTNTFTATAIAQADYGLEEAVFDLNVAGAPIAPRPADAFGPHRVVAGSVGPTNQTLSLSPRVNEPAYRTVSFDRMAEAYAEQLRGLVEGGIDLLLIETIFDTLNAKAAIAAASDAAPGVPLMISVTITVRSGRTLSGQTEDAFWLSIAHAEPFSVGVNCALGAAEMRPYLESLARIAPVYTTCHPNAGLPNAFGGYDERPETTSKYLREFAESGLANVLGGCCGTTDEHVRAIAAAVNGLPPRRVPAEGTVTSFSGLEPFSITPETGFVMVGERQNVTGSARFRKLIEAGDYQAAVEIAADQVRSGANMLDVNMDADLLDGVKAMTTFLNLIATEPEIARVPVMVDSSKWDVLEAGLKCLQGKGIVNSISLKGGEEDFLEKGRRIKRYGAAVVVMAFDEQGQADTVERKLQILERSVGLLIDRAGYVPEDIVVDPCILAIATGIEEHNAYGTAFIEATRLLRERLPGVKVSGGVSNLSFSFRGNDAVREAIHSAFLYHAIAAGLDMAIVNAGQIALYEDIPADLLEHVEDIIFDRRPEATQRMVPFPETGKGGAMKRAVAYLEPFMEQEKLRLGPEGVRAQGKVILCTVKGDVHDIGKNIVGVVLGCNNYEVIDLGVMVPPDVLLDTAAAEGCDIVGCSGLITPSLGEMEGVAKEMERRGLDLPLLIGGATTSRQHTAVRIAPEYGQPVVHVVDASRVVGVVSDLLDSERRMKLDRQNREEQERLRRLHAERLEQPLLPYRIALERRTPIAWRQEDLPEPPFTGTRVLEPDLATLREYVDWTFFFTAWELKGRYPQILDHPQHGAAARELFENANALLDRIIADGSLHARAIYGYWPASAEADDVVLAGGVRFPMLRQQADHGDDRPNRSLTDFVAPAGGDLADHVGAFACTAGHGADELTAGFEADNDDYSAIIVKSLADRFAEACAEWLHETVRREWYERGPKMSNEELIAERYRGIRPAFGYPACPDHSPKRTLFDLLDARSIGMDLTETC